jgi:hypothetical protein
VKYCGQLLYGGITLEEAELIRHILNGADEHSSECRCCKVPSSQLDWLTTFRLLSQATRSRFSTKIASPSSTGISSPSKAHSRYTLTTTTTTTGISSSLSVPQNTPPSSPTASACGNVGPQAQPSSSGSDSQEDYFWVVFGIKDMRGFDAIENIKTQVQLRDTTFFEDLKRRHGRHRWLFQQWFSPYRFRYCKFVKVSATSKLDTTPVITLVVRTHNHRRSILFWGGPSG